MDCIFYPESQYNMLIRYCTRLDNKNAHLLLSLTVFKCDRVPLPQCIIGNVIGQSTKTLRIGPVRSLSVGGEGEDVLTGPGSVGPGRVRPTPTDGLAHFTEIRFAIEFSCGRSKNGCFDTRTHTRTVTSNNNNICQ